MQLFSLSILLVCCMAVLCDKARYDYYRIYTVEVETEAQLNIMVELESRPDGIWFVDTPYKFPQKFEMLVPPHKFAHISELFDNFRIKNSVRINNFQEVIDNEQPPNPSANFSWNQFNDLPTFNKWMDELLQLYPEILTEFVFGKSYENRPLRALKISHRPGNPTIFIESTIHAREWISAATVSYFINELLTSNDTTIRTMANNYDWMIVPILNVDGYDYTHRKDRMWRKNRVPNEDDPLCTGTDLNRNFDFHHGDAGSSSKPCSETYQGPYAFSAPETLALSKFIETIDDIRVYLAFHSYGQLMIFPYGHTTEHAENYDDLKRVGKATTKAISKRYGTQYVTGSVAEVLYFAAGASIDWVYAIRNVSLAYTMEFRDQGDYGFILPANQIIPNALEIIDGLKAMVKEAESLKYL